MFKVAKVKSGEEVGGKGVLQPLPYICGFVRSLCLSVTVDLSAFLSVCTALQPFLAISAPPTPAPPPPTILTVNENE